MIEIDISEEIDINKTNASKECDICHHWYFKVIGFKYERYLCSGCHNLMQKAMNFNDVAIVSIKGRDYRIHFWYISKNNAINIMNNSNLNRNRGVLYLFFNMSECNSIECNSVEETCYQKKKKKEKEM